MIMPRLHYRFAALTLLCVASGCSSVYQGQDAGREQHKSRNFEFFSEEHDLEEVRLDDYYGNSINIERPADRERRGVRLSWGRESARGFFQVFREDWTSPGVPRLNPPNTVFETFQVDLTGMGGGIHGVPTVGPISDEVELVLPYRASFALASGTGNLGPVDAELNYFEFQGDLALGVRLSGVTASAGIAVSALFGVANADDEPLDDAEITAYNTGIFTDLSFKHPNFPIYAHARIQTGEYEGLSVGVGVRF
ncbi:MAG: hypothetical protein ACI8QC_003874 [Planctomycetota bacterium]|jgi:hypothetical protein